MTFPTSSANHDDALMLCAYPTYDVIVALNIRYFTILIWEVIYDLSPSDDETEVWDNL
jgi:hypothetical protein